MKPLLTAAVHHPPGETLEVFAADDDGAVKVVWKRRNEPWQRPHRLTDHGFVPPGSLVAAAHHPPGRTLEAFVVAVPEGADDTRQAAVHVIWKIENEGWNSPFPITDPRECPIPVGAHLAAVHHPPGQTLEVFFVDSRGAARVVWKRRNEPWQQPHRLTRDGFAPPGSPIAAAHHPPGGTLEAFVVALPEGVDDTSRGAVHVIWKVENEPWNPPVPITDPRGCPIPVGAHLAAVHHPPGQTLEVFFADSRGAARVLWKRRNEPWQPPYPMTRDDFAPPGAPVAAARYPFAETLEAFVAGDDAVWLLWKAATGPWQAPYPLTEVGSVPARTSLSAAYHPPGETLEVFVGDVSVLSRVIWKDHNRTWRPCPIPIAPRSGPITPPWGAAHVTTSREAQVTGGSELASAGVLGVDLGANTEHRGSQFFFFGDVPRGPRKTGPPHDADLVAYARTLGPSSLDLASVLGDDGLFAPFTVLRSDGAFAPLTNQTPTGAFSYGEDAYVFVLVFEGPNGEPVPNWVPGGKVVSLLTSSPDPASGNAFKLVLRMSESRFWQVAPWVVRNADHPGLPQESAGVEHGVVMLAGGYNPQLGADAVHLAWMPLPVPSQAPKDAVRYYTADAPTHWTSASDEAAATPLWQLLPGYTSLSMAWIAAADRWVVLYSKALFDPPGGHYRVRRPIVARVGRTLADLADAEEIVAFDPCREAAYGRYMHWPDLDQLHTQGTDHQLGWPNSDPGWAYGAFIVAPLTRWDPADRTLTLSYLLSTSRPYQVQLMRSSFHVP